LGGRRHEGDQRVPDGLLHRVFGCAIEGHLRNAPVSFANIR
jgi:hypothetical protein